MSGANIVESDRVAGLLDAEAKAHALFDEVVTRGLIAPGLSESAVSDAVRDLAADMFGTPRYWHKRIVRAGPNTLLPYNANPPERTLDEDDICFLDFGPIFAEWEADFGRTYVLGDDPAKLALRDALTPMWHRGRDYFDAHPDITGEQLYDWVVEQANGQGWDFTAPIAGHLVGEFPHKKISGTAVTSYIAPGSTTPMRRLDPTGRACHWILEIHLISREHSFGGFFEQLLDVR